MIPPMTPDVSADATQAARDQKHERILAALLRFERSPSALKTAEAREIANDAHEWMRALMCDLRGHETALTAAEAQRDAALTLAGERLEALRPFAVSAAGLEAEPDPLGSYDDLMEVNYDGLKMGDLRRAAALVASASEPPQQQQHDDHHDDQP